MSVYIVNPDPIGALYLIFENIEGKLYKLLTNQFRSVVKHVFLKKLHNNNITAIYFLQFQFILGNPIKEQLLEF